MIGEVIGLVGGLLTRFLDWLRRHREVGIETWPHTIGRNGFWEHDAEVEIFNNSDQERPIAHRWVDLRRPGGRYWRNLVAQSFGEDPPKTAPAGDSVKDIVHIQPLVDIECGNPPEHKVQYRIGVQLGTRKKRHSQWVDFPPRSEAYAGGNTAPRLIPLL